MVRRLLLAWSLTLLVLVVGLLSSEARAGDKALAESLFQAGKQAMAEGNYVEACSKFAASIQQDRSVGSILNLGQCFEKRGMIASAWAQYLEGATLARERGEGSREEVAREMAQAVEGKISRLTISATQRHEGLVVQRNGEPVPVATLGVPTAVDPGEYRIEVSAPGHQSWSTTVTVGAEGDRQTVTVPPLEPSEEPLEQPEAAPPPAGAPLPAGAAPSEPADGGDGLLVAGFVVAGVGAAGLVVGGIMGGLAASDASTASDACPDQKCTTTEDYDTVESGRSKALVSTIGFAVGGAAVAAGVVMILLSSSGDDDAEAASLQWTPWLGPEAGGVGLEGRF